LQLIHLELKVGYTLFQKSRFSSFFHKK
jgi:hypothetical protein